MEGAVFFEHEKKKYFKEQYFEKSSIQNEYIFIPKGSSFYIIDVKYKYINKAAVPLTNTNTHTFMYTWVEMRYLAFCIYEKMNDML